MSNAHVDSSTPQDDSEDIFRGERPPSPRPSSPSRHSTVSSSSSSILGGRLGAIAAKLEQAISRWAGIESSDSSSSSSSSSDSSSRSRTTRRTRAKSEHDISTRISRMQAREESRQIPRQFALYLPPSLAPPEEVDKRRLQTTSELPLILSQLETALKQSTRARRQRERRIEMDNPKPQPFALPDNIKAPSRAASFTDLNASSQRKGKVREGQSAKPVPIMPKAWFLDVSSPTWDDMRAIGKLLHLHPLTLEDILMKDPREKLESFARLGYYFISFRAIESWDYREKNLDQDGDSQRQGTVDEANVYLVVFNEGICSFHFTDIADHIDRVRNRILSLEKVVNMSSDWIAHGILDSIVDSFFPFLQGLEKEVMAIEDIVFSGQDPSHTSSSTLDVPIIAKIRPVDDEKAPDFSLELSEKNVARLNAKRAHFSLPWPSFLVKWRINIPLRSRKAASLTNSGSSSPTASTLHRMARARRLITSLSRLLASKSEVVAQLRKRLHTSSLSELGVGVDLERTEVAMYLGDVQGRQDHILALSHSLSHYERLLSQSHPQYISHIRSTVAISKSGTDKALIYLSAVSIGVLCVQTLIGTCSINVRVPSNAIGGTRYNVFGVVISLSILVLVSYINLVLHWWRTAKRRTGRKSAAL
ncbi:hypothetical protein R3P38DRAFT_2823375 [Favolaschia claudopus]|uniref:Uncharacterized protein n=1 Tax=Favolaschia claudopus TaxID=2862362 RepID=A0AAW0EI25_9AGAR